MKTLGTVFLLFFLTLLSACSEQQVVAELRSLSGSEDAVFLCRDGGGVGHPYTDCPDRNASDDDRSDRQLSVFALVSQTLTDEVAVVNVTAGHVLDVDPATPGYGFLRIGGRPVSMAATPGGAATFVATADVGRNGIFALPTACLSAPGPSDPPRDLTSWPACRLDETPGEIAVVVDKSDGAGCEPSERTEPGAICTADLSQELRREGTAKLVVSFPDSGRLGVLDAQEVLNQPGNGAFPPCHVQYLEPLKVEVTPGATQSLPSDIRDWEGEPALPVATVPGTPAPRPAGFALTEDRLFIADQAAPVIHVLDTTNVCGMTELPSLLPMSLREPQRVVTTRKVAVSPLTPSGQRFAYAIDSEDQPGASVMVFDISPGSTDLTPLVRSGSPELLGEKPDRLSIGASAKDITFAYRDIPYVDPATGAAQFGKRCNPDPNAAEGTPETLARPNSDYTVGARPGLLRGLFGFILLSNGAIAVVDIEDFDADCRRPIAANKSRREDYRGCSRDGMDGFFTKNSLATGQRLVTDEVSCRVVEPHRFRSARLALNSTTLGNRAPALRGFPQLSFPSQQASVGSDERPRLLPVPFEAATDETTPVPAEVFVGATRYNTTGDGAERLPTNPNDDSTELLASLNAVVLPPLEPRAYAAEDTVTLTYEGSYAGDRASGFLRDGETEGQALLTDASLSFCAAGVYDAAALADYATNELQVAAEDDVAAFATRHADYVQIITAFPAATDSYWKKAALSRSACERLFGRDDDEVLLPSRDFTIVSAEATRLVLEPRSGQTKPPTWAEVKTCFPTVEKYRLRAGHHWVLGHSASGFRHDVIADYSDQKHPGACVRSKSPLKRWAKARVFEIAASDCSKESRVGCPETGEVCVYKQGEGKASSGVALGGPASTCIFNGLNERFALYRGRVPSPRDAVFTWQTTGGFAPLLMSLSQVSAVVSPQSIQFLQAPEQLAVVDGASQGLSLFSLDTFAQVKPSPFY